ncbi:MAG: NAD(P)/FAD-dependent oxidoreductase, partial [Rhizobiales bacterium]|nr:NAD(P)/FAD-dependent oxidoreductase [Hyphomicrobiales bacterium]
DGAYGETLGGQIGHAEQVAWRDLRARLIRFASVLSPFKEMTPPRLGAMNRDLLTLGRLGLKIKGLGRDEMREFLRLILINVADVLDDELTDERLKGVVAFDATLGTHLGPRSPNSLLLLYNRLAGAAHGVQAGLGLPRGGMSAVADAMAKAAQALGVETRTGARIDSIIVEKDRAAGVKLASGEEIRATLIVSAVNPKTTFLDLLGTRHLDTGFVRRVQNIRMRGNAAKLHLALSAAPDFRGADLRSRLVIAPSVRAVEDAFNPAKYHEFSLDPVMEIIVPSAFDASLAPSGQHVLSAIVQYAPYQLKGGWDTARAQFQDRIMASLERHALGIGKLVIASELLTPEDLEKQYGFVGGNWHHGELAVEQMLFLRPAIGAAQYDTPMRGLYLAGAGSHPGGGISGAAGWNAAERILSVEGKA